MTAFKNWKAKDPFRESAVIAYYTIFSLPGLLVVVIALAGYFVGREAVNKRILTQITSTMGTEVASQIKNIIDKASETKDSIWAALIGIITMLAGATGVFGQFQKSLNVIWEVKVDESKTGIWNLIRVRVLSFGLILAFAFILIVSLVISSMLSAVGNWLGNHFSESLVVLLQLINFILSLGVLAVLFGLMFKFFPDAKIKWKDVWIGAVVTAFLFEIGKFALEFYFGKTDPATEYGAAGSIILIMLWVTYSSMIVLYGAEFTRAYTIRQSGQIIPSEIAQKDPDAKKKS